MFFKTRKELKESKEIIEQLLDMIDHIHDGFTKYRQRDIRYRKAKNFLKKESVNDRRADF